MNGKRSLKIKSKYIFGHFELPNFYMNAMVQMPDTGELQADVIFKHSKNMCRVDAQTCQKVLCITLGNALSRQLRRCVG